MEDGFSLSFDTQEVQTNTDLLSFDTQSSPTVGIQDTLTAQERAIKYDYALGKEYNSPGKQALFTSITSGTEDYERYKVSLDESLKLQQARLDIVDRFISDNSSKGIKPSQDDVNKIMSLGSQDVINTLSNPDTIMEKLYARRVLNDTTTLSEDKGVLSDALSENQEVVDSAFDIGEFIIAKKEAFQRILEHKSQEYNELNGWGKASSVVASAFVPFYSSVMSVDAIKEAPTTSYFKGTNIEEQMAYLWSLPLDEARFTLKQTVDSIWKESPVDAVAFAQAALSYSSSDKFIDNLFDVLDLATAAGGIASAVSKSSSALKSSTTGPQAINLGKGITVPPKGPKGGNGLKQISDNKTERLVNGIKRITSAASKQRLATAEELAEASGNFDKGSEIIIYKKTSQNVEAPQVFKNDPSFIDYTELARANSEGTLSSLKNEIPTLFNLDKVIGTTTGASISAERARRIQNVLETQATRLTEALNPDNLVRVDRLSDEVVDDNWSTIKNKINTLYDRLDDSVLDVVHVPADETLGNVDKVNVLFGTIEGTAFTSKAEAVNFADNVAKLLNYEVVPAGENFLVKVAHVIDETSPDISKGLFIPTKHETPKGFLNTFLSLLRSSNDLNSADMSTERLLTVIGSTKLTQLVKESANQIGKLPKADLKNLGSFLSKQRDYIDPTTKARGRFSQNLMEFEKHWFKQFNSLPTEKQTEAYFRYTQLSDFDWYSRNISIYRDKARLGIQHFNFPHVSDSLNIEGKLIDEIPWGSKEKAGILYLGDGKIAPKYYRKEFTSRQKIVDDLADKGSYRIIQLTHIGQQDLRNGSSFYNVPTNGSIEFLIVPDTAVKQGPLPLKQIPYRPGGHVEVEGGFFIRQPDVVQSVRNGQVDDSVYYGDKNIFHVASKKDGELFTKRFNTARQMLLNKTNPSIVEQFVKENLPISYNSFMKLFRSSKNKEGILDPKVPVYLTAKNETVDSAIKLSDIYPNFRSIKDSEYNLYATVNQTYASTKSDELYSITSKDMKHNNSSVMFKLGVSDKVDPFTVLDNSVNSLMNGVYIEDLKIKAANQFVREFSRVLETPLDEMLRNPFKHVLNPKFKQGVRDREVISAAKNFRRTLLQLMNVKSDFQKSIEYYKNKLATSVIGEKAKDITPDWLLHTLDDPVKYIRSIAFHSKMGFWNVNQLFVQANTLTHINSIAGPVKGGIAMEAALMQRFARFTDNPKVLDKLASLAQGWTKEEFLESYEALRKVGWDRIGGEVSAVDDFLDPKVVQGTIGRTLDNSLVLFRESERYIRMTAWNAAYKEWKANNKYTKLSKDADIKSILQRADNLSVNMTSASNAAWQKGVLSIPTQFWSYQARLMEQVLGKRLTAGEKGRLLLGYSIMYGVPTGVGGTTVGALWPVQEEVRKGLMDRGIDYDNNLATKLLFDGIPSVMLEGITGTKWDIPSRYGPSGNSMIKDLLRGDKTFLEALGGVSGSSIAHYMSTSEPFFKALASTMYEDKYPLKMSDVTEFFKGISTVNNISKAYYAIAYGQYVSKNQTVLDEVSASQGIFMALTGLQPQEVSDAYLKVESMKDLQEHQKGAATRAIKNYRLGFKSTDDEERLEYFKRASMELIGGMFTPQEKTKVLSQALKGYESLVEKVAKEFDTLTPERLNTLMNKIDRKQ